MLVRKLRLQKGWSQEQLAELSCLSVRTIQRIERGHKPGLESANALAAVFELDVEAFTQEAQMTESQNRQLEEEKAALEYVREVKGFYSHLATFLVVMVFLFGLNLYITPGYLWAGWALMGWGIGVVSHGLSVFEISPFGLLGPDWEKRQVEKRLGRKL